MNRLRPDNFEQAWQDAFHGATHKPSADLWNRIEEDLVIPDLENENSSLKKRLFTVYWFAAASVAFAFFAGSISQYMHNQTENKPFEIPMNEVATGKDIEPDIEHSTPLIAVEKGSEFSAKEIDRQKSKNNDFVGINSKETIKNKQGNKKIIVPRKSLLPQLARLNHEEDRSILYGSNTISPVINEENTLNKNANLSFADKKGLDFEPGEIPDLYPVHHYNPGIVKPTEEKRNLWAGLSMGGGSYGASGVNLGSPLMYGAEMNVTSDASYASSSYRSEVNGHTQGVGVLVGKKISDRMSVMGGVQYSAITSGIYQGSDYSLSQESSGRIARNFLSNTNNEGFFQKDKFSFINLPARIGLSLFKKKFDVIVYSGIDSRIFVGNSSSQYDTSDSQYAYVNREVNPVTFWGGINTEFVYNFSENYRISVMPGYKIALNELEKGSGDHPVLADVGVSLKYVFR